MSAFSWWSFVAGFLAFPVCISVLGLLVWHNDRKLMRGIWRDTGK